MGNESVVTACVIVIGNEVLSGRTPDANVAFLGTALNEVGIRLAEARIVADDRDAIVGAVNACRGAFGYVFTTGGIGPTHDDITSACVAEAFGVRMERRPEALRLLQQQYRPADLNDARLKMADIPEGAKLIDNPVSHAPGYRIGNVFVLPGVPSIMRAMFDGLRGELKGGAPLLSHTIAAFTTEGSIAARLADIQARHEGVEIGSYPFVRDGRLGTSLVMRTTDTGALERVAREVRTAIEALGAEAIEDSTD